MRKFLISGESKNHVRNGGKTCSTPGHAIGETRDGMRADDAGEMRVKGDQARGKVSPCCGGRR